MSIDMYLSKSKNQSSDVNKLSKDIKNGYDSVIKANSKFISETGLKGKAFDSGKEFFESIISPLLLSMKTLSDLTEQACQEFVNKYISEVDSQSLKESELEEDIRELEVRIAHLESMTISLKQKSSKNRTAINGNKNMISSLEHQKEELEKKLRKLRQFNQTSPAIFKEVESFQKTVQKGINQAKTSWNPGKQTFDIPSGKQLDWAKVVQNKYLDVEMKKINSKSKNQKLNKKDLQTIMNYAQSHPKEDVPKSLKEYLIQNRESVSRDLGIDLATNGIEQVGFGIQKFGGVLNTYGGYRGPKGKKSFVQVTNSSGNKMIKNGKTIAKVGKFGGTTMIGVGFGLGMYDDLKNENKTVGEATAHNTLTTGAGIGASLAAGVGITFLVSNPAGWAVLGGIAIGAGVAFGADIMYQNNTLGLKDGVDWTGHQIDKGIKGYTNLLRKKNKLESQAVDFTANQIKSSYNSLKPKISDLQNDVGASIKEVKKSVNPMKWSW